MKKGNVFVVSAPSGSGKTTICERVLKKLKNIRPSVSVTTRRPRPGEKHKKDYHYSTKENFKKKIKKGHFLEWAANFGYYYGTPKTPVLSRIKRGKDVILSIDVKGAMQIKKKLPESILVFVKPPSMQELKRRLKKRNTDGKKEIAKRLKIAKKELSYMPKYKYVVVNDRLNTAVRELVSIIKKEKRGVACHMYR